MWHVMPWYQLLGRNILLVAKYLDTSALGILLQKLKARYAAAYVSTEYMLDTICWYVDTYLEILIGISSSIVKPSPFL